jgi:hypothetical protein
MNKTLANSCNSPHEHDEGQPIGGLEFFDEYIRRNFEEDVGDEKDEKSDIVLVAMHAKVSF